ncbi:MAG: hypothetical protein ACC628_24255 [Pirellulaceae bacterium]
MTAQIAGHAEVDLESTRRASLTERAGALATVCRAAAALEASRCRAGLPDPVPAPWPQSTWEFLAKHAQSKNGHRGVQMRRGLLPLVDSTTV